MSQLQYLPGDPRLVDQLVYELKSKGIFDQFRKECIADVDTRPAYQNLRQRVESSVASFLSRQIWKPDANKNQLREKLRKHLLDGNYLEQGVERIVDQVVNPKVASVFIPQVEDLVYNYLGIPRKKTSANVAETSVSKASDDLLPTDLEAVSPGSVKSNDDKPEPMDTSDVIEETKMETDDEKTKVDIQDDSIIEIIDIEKQEDSKIFIISDNTQDANDIIIDNSTTTIPLPSEEIKLENIPAPECSPPNIKDKNIDLEKINLPKEPNLSTDIPLPDEMPKVTKDAYFKPLGLTSEDDESSSDSSLIRNMSPLTPIRNFNNENSCDAQQGFDNDSDSKGEEKKEPNTFKFAIESKTPENSSEAVKIEKKESEQVLSYQFTNQINLNSYNTPLYDDSSNSNNLHIDYESDANSKATNDTKLPEPDQNSGDVKKDKKPDDKSSKSSHKSSHRSRDSHRHSGKDKRSDSKHSTSRDSSRHDKKSSKEPSKDSAKEEHKSKPSSSSHKERSSDRGDRKDSRDSSKHRSSSHKSHSSSKDKDSKHKSSSKSSSKHDDRKSTSSSKDKDKDRKDTDKNKDKPRDSKSSSHRSDKDRKSSSSSNSKTKSDEKENKEKKEKKETDDHYSVSGRGNPNRRSTDRDSNDGSSSSKGSHNPSSTKSENKKGSKSSTKSDNNSSSGGSTSPSDKDTVVNDIKDGKQSRVSQSRPAVRVDTHLEAAIKSPPRLPFVPDVTLKKPKFAANLEEAKKMMKMRKFLEDEQKRMNQEAALLLEFQANVRPSLSQVYSSIPGPELEFACVSNTVEPRRSQVVILDDNECVAQFDDSHEIKNETTIDEAAGSMNKDSIAETLIAMHLEHNVDETHEIHDNEDMENSDYVKSAEQSKNDIIQALTDEDCSETDVEEKETFEIQIENIECEDNVIIVENDMVIMKEDLETDSETIQEETVQDENDEVIEHSEPLLHYFPEHEKYVAELETDRFHRFFKSYTKQTHTKLYLINCNSYEENLIKEASENFGTYQIVNYHKNGHFKPKPSKNIVKNLNITNEVTLPTKPTNILLSPVKSESSFELHSDYDAKLEEMVNKASRQEIMEIILGSAIDESPSKMPRIDYCMESSIEPGDNGLKRKLSDVETNVNNNRPVLTPNKIRKISASDQISSTTEEADETPNNILHTNARSKYLGKARRVGLPKPKRNITLPNSPNSDKSIENYTEQPTVRKKPRDKVQRYSTADLYKPKLHYLCRRNLAAND